MKDITEKEALAALKKAMPWATYCMVDEPYSWDSEEPDGLWTALAYCAGVRVERTGQTLRSAVNAAIRAAKRVGAAK